MSLVLCVLLWPYEGHDADLAVYEDKVLALMPDCGGRVVQRVRSEGGDGPLEVQILEFPSEGALDAFMKDPRRTALASDRDVAIAKTEVIRVRPIR